MLLEERRSGNKKVIELQKKKLFSEKERKQFEKEVKEFDSITTIKLEEIEIIAEKSEKIRHELKIKNSEIKTQERLIKVENNKIHLYTIFLIFGTLAGIILAIYGFSNWFKLQKKFDNNFLKSNKPAGNSL